MTPHYCKEEQSHMMISGCCNWCGMKESPHIEVISDHLAWVTWAVVVLVVIGCAEAISFFLGKLI
jgi:hypothetical protein